MIQPRKWVIWESKLPQSIQSFCAITELSPPLNNAAHLLQFKNQSTQV